jgi:hypothetical protein
MKWAIIIAALLMWYVIIRMAADGLSIPDPYIKGY